MYGNQQKDHKWLAYLLAQKKSRYGLYRGIFVKDFLLGGNHLLTSYVQLHMRKHGHLLSAIKREFAALEFQQERTISRFGPRKAGWAWLLELPTAIFQTDRDLDMNQHPQQPPRWLKAGMSRIQGATTVRWQHFALFLQHATRTVCMEYNEVSRSV